MLYFLRRTATLPVFSALAWFLLTRTCTAQTYPIIIGKTTIELAFAPDGQSLWSEEWSGQLVIRSGDGKTETYRGALPNRNGGELRVLKDGSFLRATKMGALQWFEPPQTGQPLRVRSELAAPPTMDWETDIYSAEAKIARGGFGGGIEPGDLRSAGALAVAPDEKRMAVSFTIRRRNDDPAILGNEPPKQEIIRVWNLQSGAVEMEQKVELPGLRDGEVEAGEFPYDPACLGWADAQTLVVARGLSVERFDATTGQQISAWRPANAQRAFVTAELRRLRKRQSISSIEVNEYLKFAPPVAFDAEAQELMALSDDGRYLVMRQWKNLWGAPLLTLWDSATDEAQILSEERGIAPTEVTISHDGTKVAAWNNWDVRSWNRENRSSPFTPSISSVTSSKTIRGGGFGSSVPSTTTPKTWLGPVRVVALTGDRIAWARDFAAPYVARFGPKR